MSKDNSPMGQDSKTPASGGLDATQTAAYDALSAGPSRTLLGDAWRRLSKNKLAIVAIVGVAAHHYRKNLPKAWKKTWRLHHGMYTFVGTLLFGVLIILATGGGQI